MKADITRRKPKTAERNSVSLAGRLAGAAFIALLCTTISAPGALADAPCASTGSCASNGPSWYAEEVRLGDQDIVVSETASWFEGDEAHFSMNKWIIGPTDITHQSIESHS